MSDQWHMGCSAVCEAINRLTSLGLVCSAHGSGTRVETPSGRPITQTSERMLRLRTLGLAQLAQVRLPLETTIAGIAAWHRTDEQLKRLESTQDILTLRRAELEAQVRAVPIFNLVLALAPIQELLIESRRRTLGRHGARLAHDHHALILDAVRGRDESGAIESMRRH